MATFDLTSTLRADLSASLQAQLEHYYHNTSDIPIGRHFQKEEVIDYVNSFDLERASDPKTVVKMITEGLSNYAIHTPHESYFGLFNPRPGYASILADQISATFNPQLAAWSHAPFANEIERKCISELANRLGFNSDLIDGTFCSGGAESNLTALLCALNSKYPNMVTDGMRALTAMPTIYVSAESHHSIHKAAKVTGLGINTIRTVKVDSQLKMDIEDLNTQILHDLEQGHEPLMIVATTGTTGAGAIDDVHAIQEVSKNFNTWLHVDAAYGAGLKISNKYGDQLGPVHLADSITIDLHKWFAVPMGASMIIVKDKTVLPQTFSIHTDYMPEDDLGNVVDPYANSIQWSRRAIGLKFFMPLAIHGWNGYEEMITKEIELAEYLRSRLSSNGWIIKNDTIMPIVCFTHPDIMGHTDRINSINEQIIESGQAWCSTYPIHGEWCIRACIINYATTEEDIKRYVDLLNSLLPTIKR